MTPGARLAWYDNTLTAGGDADIDVNGPAYPFVRSRYRKLTAKVGDSSLRSE